MPARNSAGSELDHALRFKVRQPAGERTIFISAPRWEEEVEQHYARAVLLGQAQELWALEVHSTVQVFVPHSEVPLTELIKLDQDARQQWDKAIRYAIRTAVVHAKTGVDPSMAVLRSVDGTLAPSVVKELSSWFTPPENQTLRCATALIFRWLDVGLWLHESIQQLQRRVELQQVAQQLLTRWVGLTTEADRKLVDATQPMIVTSVTKALERTRTKAV